MTSLYIDPAAGAIASCGLIVLAAFTFRQLDPLPVGRVYSFPCRPRLARRPVAFLRKGKMVTHKHVPIAEEADASLDPALSRPPGRDRWAADSPGRGGDFRDRAARGLGRYLRAARLNHGWSLDDVSRRAGVDRATVIALEHGILTPSQIRRSWLARLARALGEDLDDLGLLLGVPLPRGDEALEEPRCFLSASFSPSGAAELDIQLTYHGAGWRNSRERFRAARPWRDPERLFFDK